MQKTNYIWRNGKWLLWDEAKTHVVTHALHYGSGVFEGIRVYETKDGPAIFRLQDHLKRLLYSASRFDMKVPYTLTELEKATKELVKKNNLNAGYIRPLIIYGEDYMVLRPQSKKTKLDVYFICWPWGALLGTEPIKVGTSTIRRISSSSFDPKAKITGIYANSILSSLEMHTKGFEESLMLDQDGYIAEGPGENIFFVKNNALYTPEEGSILPGITRDTIMHLAKTFKIKVKKVHWKLKDLKQVEESFFTGTATEVAPIVSIDKVTFKENFGPVTQKLRNAYLNVVHGRNPEHKKWLTYVY